MIKRFLKDEEASTAIEYGLIAALIALAIVASLGNTGNSVSAIWNSNANKVVNALN